MRTRSSRFFYVFYPLSSKHLVLFTKTFYDEYMRELLIGYLLITVGIVVMGFSVFQVYGVFTNQVKPFVVFQEEEKEAKKPSFTTQDLMTNPSLLSEMQTNMLSGILEKQMNKTINTGATVFLYYFVMLFGFRLAMIGTNLVRPITVKLRSNVVELADEPKEKAEEKPKSEKSAN